MVAFLGFLWVCEWVLFFFALLNRGQIGFLRGVYVFWGVWVGFVGSGLYWNISKGRGWVLKKGVL